MSGGGGQGGRGGCEKDDMSKMGRKKWGGISFTHVVFQQMHFQTN